MYIPIGPAAHCINFTGELENKRIHRSTKVHTGPHRSTRVHTLHQAPTWAYGSTLTLWFVAARKDSGKPIHTGATLMHAYLVQLFHLLKLLCVVPDGSRISDAAQGTSPIRYLAAPAG